MDQSKSSWTAFAELEDFPFPGGLTQLRPLFFPFLHLLSLSTGLGGIFAPCFFLPSMLMPLMMGSGP